MMHRQTNQLKEANLYLCSLIFRPACALFLFIVLVAPVRAQVIDTIIPGNVCGGDTLRIISGSSGNFSTCNSVNIGGQNVAFQILPNGSEIRAEVPFTLPANPPKKAVTISGTWGSLTDTVILKGPSPSVLLSYSIGSTAKYCTGGTGNAPISVPIITGNNNLISIPPGMQFLPSGAPNLSTSLPGNYLVLYQTNVGSYTCPGRDEDSVRIIAKDTVSLTYPKNNFCQADPPQPVTLYTNSTGVFQIISQNGGSLSINTTQGNPHFGKINPAASDPDSFLVIFKTTGYCSAKDTYEIVIDTIPDASFSYSKSALCPGESALPPIGVSLGGGIFLSVSGLLLDSLTGIITPTGSQYGTYWIHQLITINSCPSQDSFQVQVVAPDPPYFSYPQSIYCHGAGSTIPDTISSQGGLFSELTGSIVFLNNQTGLIDLGASNPGGPFAITYTAPGACGIDSSVNITLIPKDTATFAYKDSICINGADPLPAPMTAGVTVGGTFSLLSGISIVHPMSGKISLSSSQAGVIVIQYLTPGQCPDSTQDTLQILAPVNPTFFFPYDTTCAGNLLDTAIITGVKNGTFAAAIPSLQTIVFLDPHKGILDLAASDKNSALLISYTTHPDSGCPDTAFFPLTILEEFPNLTYPFAQYCQGQGTCAPNLPPTTGGTFSTPPNIPISSSNGQINLSNLASQQSFFVTYTTPFCGVRDSFHLTLYPQSNASFAYFKQKYCRADSFAKVNLQTLADSGGTFSAVSPGLAHFIDSKGTIDLTNPSQTSTDSLWVKYFVPSPIGGCSDSSYFLLIIEEIDQVNHLVYPYQSICNNADSLILIQPLDTTLLPGNFSHFPPGPQLDMDSYGTINLHNSQPGTYTIDYHVSGSCSFKSSHSLTILPPDESDFSYPKTIFCEDDGFFSPLAMPGSPGSFSIEPYFPGILNPDSGIINLATGFQIDPGTFTNNDFTISFQSQGLCPAQTEIEIRIFPAPEVKLIPSPGYMLCEDESWGLLALAPPFSATQYQFILDHDTNSSTIGYSPEFLLNEIGTPQAGPGQHLVSLTATSNGAYGGCSWDTTVTLEIKPRPQITNLQLTDPNLEQLGITIYLTADADSTIYTWDYGNSINFKFLSIPDLDIPKKGGEEGQYSLTYEFEEELTLGRVWLTFYPEARSCAGTPDSILFTVNPRNQELFIPGVFTPNGDGKNDYWYVQAGDGFNLGDYRAEIFNRSGGLVHSINPLVDSWDGASLPDGVYWYLIYGQNSKKPQFKGGLTIKRSRRGNGK
ncbi:MAG: gliding motility-associated C-terminal domain-containing protein [Bacteroidia bacterium]|nr:gliding motility-associated C-terminal domain-containing protein [Bacteroidia bacterium]